MGTTWGSKILVSGGILFTRLQVIELKTDLSASLRLSKMETRQGAGLEVFLPLLYRVSKEGRFSRWANVLWRCR